jgi:uroporphyrin-III C-methyltransferase / precorrin-2 dehydrogenase / sirohydrochlorin ferrochelatase
VGGGVVAERKARLLLGAGAQLSVGAPALTATLREWRDGGRLLHLAGTFETAWLADQRLVIAATDDAAINRQVAAAAEAHDLFVNVVDDAALSSFQVPAIVDRAPLMIAISSGGAAPMLARRVRERLEATLEHSLGPLARLLDSFRARIRTRFSDLAQRRRFYDDLLDGDVARLVEQAQVDAAAAVLSAALEDADPASDRAGCVSLVGAGPGNPDLLTLAALRALSRADVVLFDRLTTPGILAKARRDAMFIDVGKQGGGAHVPQEETHRLLLEHARRGAHVVRLKGGDPFVFGRGGEEIEFLRAQGVPYRVIPGITAALACAAYAGIPLTHRDHAQSLRLLTAHCKTGFSDEDWAALGAGRQTLAIYMGVRELPELRAKLIAHGADPDTPFALVENGSLPQQRTVCGALSQLVELAAEHAVSSPALLIVGPTAHLARRLHWYGVPPLSNVPVAARAPAAASMADAL